MEHNKAAAATARRATQADEPCICIVVAAARGERRDHDQRREKLAAIADHVRADDELHAIARRSQRFGQSSGWWNLVRVGQAPAARFRCVILRRADGLFARAAARVAHDERPLVAERAAMQATCDGDEITLAAQDERRAAGRGSADRSSCP